MTHDVLRLFPDFRAPSWRPWRVFKAALDGRPLRGEDLALFQHCTGRQAPPREPVSECYTVVGRRGGKSRLSAALAVEAACLRDWTGSLAPGEWATVAVIAADRSQARNVFQYVEGLIDGCGPLAAQVVRRTAEAIEFTGRTRIEVTTASARTTRGYTFAAVIADELAFWRSETTAEPDVEVLQAVRPGLATLLGARLVCISSPYARRGALWIAYKEHYGCEDDPVLVWQADTSTMHPTLPARVIAAAYEADPTSAAAEYGATFRTDVQGFITREVLDAVTVPGVQGLPPVRGLSYVAFVDPSGGSSDAFALAIAHAERDGDQVLAVLDHVSARRPPFSPERTVQEFCATLRAYRVDHVIGDRYGGEFPREQFRKHGVAYECSALVKSDIYREALPLLTSGRVRLLDDPGLHRELLGLERRTARGGRDSIDHGPHAHDDIANAACGALVQAATAAVGDCAVLAANLAPAPRGRILDEGEFALLGRL